MRSLGVVLCMTCSCVLASVSPRGRTTNNWSWSNAVPNTSWIKAVPKQDSVPMAARIATRGDSKLQNFSAANGPGGPANLLSPNTIPPVDNGTAHTHIAAAGSVAATAPSLKASRATRDPQEIKVLESRELGASPTYAARLPQKMVHSESPLNAAHTMAHTMRPGDSILTVGIDPFASDLVLSISGGNSPRPVPMKTPQAVHGATFAAGGFTYTASMDPNLNIVVGSSTLKPGGAAATLGGGQAVISVIPGGALVVGTGTLTMSAIHPPATGAVINVAGRVVTAVQTSGTAGKVMVIGTATMTSGGPAATISGQVVSFGIDGIAVGGNVAAISTMTYSEAAVASQILTDTRLSGFARFSSKSSVVVGAKATIPATNGASSSTMMPLPVVWFQSIVLGAIWLFGGG